MDVHFILEGSKKEGVNQEMCLHYLFDPFNARGYCYPKHNGAKIFGNHLNPVMLVFLDSPCYPYARVTVIVRFLASFYIGKISLSKA